VLTHQNDREVPVYDADIYSRHAITDPYPHYTRLRQIGPVVWLSRQRYESPLRALPERHCGPTRSMES
jgi:hypothetical protein